MAQQAKADQGWIDHVMSGAAVWDLGQIDKPTARALDRLVSRGALLKGQGRFHGISPLKTIWFMPGAAFPLHEGVRVVKACGTIWQEAISAQEAADDTHANAQAA